MLTLSILVSGSPYPLYRFSLLDTLDRLRNKLRSDFSASIYGETQPKVSEFVKATGPVDERFHLQIRSGSDFISIMTSNEFTFLMAPRAALLPGIESRIFDSESGNALPRLPIIQIS